MKFPLNRNRFNHSPLFSAIFILVFLFSAMFAAAQNESSDQMRARADKLVAAQNYTEALPLLEKLVNATPDDAELQFHLGFALMAQANHSPKVEDRMALRIRARKAFIVSKELGNNTELVKGLIESISFDGQDPPDFSKNAEADKLMREGEAFFTSGKMDEALAAYKKALSLDPKNYHAALFAGDVYTQTGKFADAEIWYQKAIAIDPNIETAYRYSATPLMRQRKFDEARDRYVEAFIIEPYSRFSTSGLIQWGQATNTLLGHPRIDLPEYAIGADGKASTNININPVADDGSLAWIGYSATRSEWHEKKFKLVYPLEKEYRHTLKEEAEALRSVITVAKELKSKTKSMNEQLLLLVKLDQEGLLEAFILMAKPDNGIARDHIEYLRTNRDKLRQYVIRYVIGAEK